MHVGSQFILVALTRELAPSCTRGRAVDELEDRLRRAYPRINRVFRAHATYRLGKRELQMARQLVESMSNDWRPLRYQDKFRARLSKVVAARLRRKGARVAPRRAASPEASAKVVDLMAVLQRSLEQKGDKRRGVPPHSRVQQLRSGTRA